MAEIKLGGKDNAIGSATFFLESDHPFSSNRLSALNSSHGDFKEELPRRMLRKAIKVELGGTGPAMTPSSSRGEEEISGITFDYLKPSGDTRWALVAEGKRLTFFCGEYTSWEEVKAQANRLIRRAYKILFQHNIVTGIGLQYLDQFYWTGRRVEMRAEKIYKSGTEYLPDSVFKYQDLWHNNQGFIEDVVTPQDGRVLTNVNANINDRDEYRWSDLVTLHVFQRLHIENEAGLFMGDGGLPIFDLILNYLHDENKKILRSLLNEDITNRIGL